MATQERHTTYIEPLIIESTAEHTATVIFVHGLGQMNHSWVPTLRRLSERLPGMKWVLPQAPDAPVTSMRERRCPSWFNIVSLPPSNDYDEPGVSASVARLEDLIIREVRQGTLATRIVLVGFSQGASLSLMTALTTLHELGGVASLSGWIPKQSRHAMLQFEPSLPIFWAHGTKDFEVPSSYGEECVSFLHSTLRIPQDKVCFKAYDGLGHNVNETVLDDLVLWLCTVLS